MTRTRGLAPTEAAVVAWLVYGYARPDCVESPAGGEPCARCLDAALVTFAPLFPLFIASNQEVT